jgi:hypothetical protein
MVQCAGRLCQIACIASGTTTLFARKRGGSGATHYAQMSTNLDWQSFTNVTIINGTFTSDAGYVTNGPALCFCARSGP